MSYGRFNQGGTVPAEMVSGILSDAASLGLSKIDTAPSYGASEAALGLNNRLLSNFALVTKTSHYPEGELTAEHARHLRTTFENSLKMMRQDRVQGVLIHHAPNLLAPGGELLYAELARLKAEGRVEQIGVSAYSGDVVEAIQARFSLDFVQLPINVLDRRLINSGSLSRITQAGTKVHARSAFLQGLVLANPAELPAEFEEARNVLRLFRRRCQARGVAPVHAALNYLLGIEELETIIVGVDTPAQLSEIFSNFPFAAIIDYSDIELHTTNILDPSRWNKP
jgi:aryl-alcohol dehydrogenase-like predicted oxidoreductase